MRDTEIPSESTDDLQKAHLRARIDLLDTIESLIMVATITLFVGGAAAVIAVWKAWVF